MFTIIVEKKTIIFFLFFSFLQKQMLQPMNSFRRRMKTNNNVNSQREYYELSI